MRILPRRKKAGLSLSELLVAMALFSVVSLVTLQLYLSAYTEFEHSSGTMLLNQRARTTVDRITQVVKTAVPVLSNNSEAFIHPNSSTDRLQDMYELDFLSSICFMPNPSLGSPAWQITDPQSAGYVADPNDPRWIYETDLGLTAFVSRQPSIYRYRIAWNYRNANVEPFMTDSANRTGVPARAVYMERLSFGDAAPGQNIGTGLGEGVNSGIYERAPWVADTGRPFTTSNMRARLLGKNIHYLTFTRESGNVIQLRIKLYNRDPATNIPVEGATMRRPGFGGNSAPGTPGQMRYFVVDLKTTIQLPNTL